MNKYMNAVCHDDLHEYIAALYLDWVNNFSSITAFAAHYGITEEEATMLINLGKRGSTWK